MVAHAEPEITRRRAALGLVSFAAGEGGAGEGGKEGEGEGNQRKRPRRHSTGAAPLVSPHPGETQATAMAATVRPTFTAPYLKGEPTHFQKKVEKYILEKMAIAASSPSPAKNLPVPAKTITTRRTSNQVNAAWQNEKAYAEDTLRRLIAAKKEATQQFVALAEGKLETGTTQQMIVDRLNKKFKLSGVGRDGSREKHMLQVRTVARLVNKGTIGNTPEKRGKKPAISRAFLKLVACHVNMEQVGVHGEMSVSQIKATLTAATLETVHQGTFNYEYAWEQVRRIHADILVPAGIVQSEEIRWQWVTYEKVKQFYDDHQVSLFILFNPFSVNRLTLSLSRKSS